MDSFKPLYNIKLDTTEDGIHLVGSVLWFDSQDTSGLSFLSSANSIHKGKLNSRVIATKATMDLLALRRLKPKAMICSYNHPVSIGQLRFELLPSGSMLGGSLLWVEADNRSLLYAPHMQPFRTEISHQMQVKPADVMVVSALVPYPAEDFPSRKREKERLLQSLSAAVAANLSPVCYAEKFATAPELVRYLSQAGLDVLVHPSIAKVCKVYADQGSVLGNYEVFAGARRSQTSGKIVILPHPIGTRSSKGVQTIDGPIFDVRGFSAFLGGKHQSLAQEPNDRFFISTECDPRELPGIIQKVNPQTLCFFGPYAKDYVRRFFHLAAKVSPLYPPHLPTLF